MRWTFVAWTCAAGLLVGCGSSAFAQYPGGYGGYGWGGWGGAGSTVGGDWARGLGVLAAGAAQLNVADAQAAAINTDTVMRWNSAVWASQQQMNINYYNMRERRQRDLNKAQSLIYSRLRDHPEERDIENGDALNVQLDLLLNPKIYNASIKELKTPLSRTLIREIPFEYASEGFTFSLHELSAEDGWPPALREPEFAEFKKALHGAMEKAIDEDAKGELAPSTIRKASEALERLRAQFEKLVPKTSPDYYPARDHLKGLAGMIRMLHSPAMEEILAGLEQAPNTTVGDLLGFMHAYNLRFGATKNRRQVLIYQELYPILVAAPRGLPDKAADDYKQVAQATPGVPPATTAQPPSAEAVLGKAASSFFRPMDEKHLKSPQ